MVKFLLENGAKVDMIDNNGMSAGDFFQENSNPKIKFMIEANSKKKNTQVKGHVKTNSF